MMHPTSIANPAAWPNPARGLRLDSARVVALLAAMILLLSALSAGLLARSVWPTLQAPAPATNGTVQVAPIRPVVIEPAQYRPTCGPEFYITGDLVGEANPLQLYRDACGPSAR